MTANVYIDGLNLCYGALKHTGFKWLNPARLCEFLLPAFDINHIEYFTALVQPRSARPDQRIRQQIYVRALRTLPNLDIVLGRFLTSEVCMQLRDAFRGKFDAAILVTNDSDLVEPIRIVREELGLVVGLLNPHKRASRVLHRYASFMRPIRKGVLRVSQFPTEIHDQQGVIRKPEGW